MKENVTKTISDLLFKIIAGSLFGIGADMAAQSLKYALTAEHFEQWLGIIFIFFESYLRKSFYHGILSGLIITFFVAFAAKKLEKVWMKILLAIASAVVIRVVVEIVLCSFEHGKLEYGFDYFWFFRYQMITAGFLMGLVAPFLKPSTRARSKN
ncbi:MAG: hypothetical protein JNN15_10985 [Blastocatellia bacterium]|nr:hypothetical protein [Blastocatellia bacterium]